MWPLQTGVPGGGPNEEAVVSLLNRLLAWRRRRHTRVLPIGGRGRSYLLHAPRGLDPDQPTPVVLALHGATMNGPLMAWYTGLNDLADRTGFLTVYPNGTGAGQELYWNAGDCCGPPARERVDDVAFLRAVLDDLASVRRIDPRRVFATGISNGAMMAYRLASELSDRVAAVAPVAGTMATETCSPARPIPVIHFHGTLDEYVPFGGGRGAKSITGVYHRSVEHSLRCWVRANGCREEPSVEELPDRADDGTHVTRLTYAGGKEGSEVVLVKVAGGGHTWPGRPALARELGRSTDNISANELMWEFFSKHSVG
jgi:polyhydroxybutyrate depolymerase